MKVTRSNRKLNNDGYSLVELLVVLAIMAVLIGGISISYYAVNQANVKKAVNEIDNAISVCRENAMTKSKSEWGVMLQDHKVSVYYLEDDDASIMPTYILSADLPTNVTLNVKVDSNSYSLADSSSGAEIVFHPSGNVSEVRVNSDEHSGAVSHTKTYFYISATYKSKTAEVMVYYSTGKHSVEE